MRSLRVEVDEDGVGLHVGVTGEGPDVLVLTGGPGCVQYLEDDAIAPRGFRAWYPEPVADIAWNESVHASLGSSFTESGSFDVVPGVPHDFWFTHPEVWLETTTEALREMAS